MKKEAEVKKRLRDVKRKYLVQMLEDNLSQHHSNCVFNHKHEDKNGVTYLCMLGANNPEEWKGTICDGDDVSMECPFFEAKKTRADIKKEFDEIMQDPVRLFDQYRDVAILLWVLGEDAGYDVKDPWYVRGLDWLKEMLNPPRKPKSLPLSEDDYQRERQD